MKPTASERVSSMLQKNPMRNIVTSIIVATAFVSVAPRTANAAAIAVPNFSFESQSAAGQPNNVNINVDAWKKIAEPAYYTPAFGGFGIPWAGTAGVFVDPVSPYVNLVGNQAGYILAAPQVALFQDYNSSPGHDFNATFSAGNAYALTIGVFGKSSIAPGSTLELSLYYRDGSDNKVKVGSTTITYSALAFPDSPPRSLIDFSVNVPAGVSASPSRKPSTSVAVSSMIVWSGRLAIVGASFTKLTVSRTRSRSGPFKVLKKIWPVRKKHWQRW